MEEKQDDIAANEATEFSMRDSNIPTNPSNSNSNFPRSSILTQFDSLNRGETLSTDVTPILRRSPYLRNDAGCSSSNEKINHDHKQESQSIGWTGQNSRIIDEEFESRSKDSSKSCSRKELKRAFMSSQDVEFSPNKQMNMDSSISSDVIEGPNISSPSFTNLREWLESKGGVDATKNDKMLVFKRIVQVVNVSHVQGIALLELRPSSFILLDTGDAEYIGSTTETELWGVPDFSMGKRWSTYQNVHFEEKWYAFPEGFETRDLLSLNVYSLGLLLFEFLCHFDSIEAHTAAMADLHRHILPPSFLSRNHKEAGFCLWLLHPEPSSRPTTREILQSDLLSGLETARSPNNDEASCVEMVDDVELDLLIHFLVKLKEEKLNKASSLLKTLNFLDSDIKMVERWRSYSAAKDQFESPSSSVYSINMLKHKLLGNMKELENAYFSVRSSQLDNEILPNMTRSDSDVLRRRDHLSQGGTRREEKHAERIGTFFDGICKFARYDKFEVCGILRNDDILSSMNKVICSLCFDPEEEYLAVAGVSKKIKIFEFHSLLNDYVDVQYPLLEMSNKSKFTCICWNNHIRNHLASTDYDGEVQIWDASTGQRFGQYKEHNKRAWSIDFSHVDAKLFASGSDDCSLKIWSINQSNSTETIWSPANVCCVQFSPCSSHLVASGSADYRIYCYDLRHTRIPWCTLAGHDNAVSYVRFLDSETIVSASIDNTLKLWNLKATTLDGVSPPHASTLTFRGHTNDKNFVGLAVLDGYIACGSETNEVYAYYKSLPMPISCHKFGSIDPTLEEANIGHFVTSVGWRKKDQMIAAANSSGIVKILRLANSRRGDDMLHMNIVHI